MAAVSVAAGAAVLIAVLAAVLPASRSVPGVLGAGPALAASAYELNEKLVDTQAELERIRANIAKAELAKKAALGDIEALDQSIEEGEKAVQLVTAARDSAARRLGSLRAQLEQVNTELADKTEQLARTERDLQARREVLNTRVVNVYKSGGRTVFLAALLEPSSLTELVGRIELLSTIVDQDSSLVAQIKDLKGRVEVQKQALEMEKVRVAALESEQRATTKELQALAAERQKSLSGLESAKKAKQRVVEKAEKDKAAWAKQEDALLAESDRIGAMLRSLSAVHPTKAGKGILSWPVDGAVTSGFGYRIHPIFHVRRLHTGVDLHAEMGTPIRAAAAGTVIFAGWRGGYGKAVIISHGDGLATLYAHQSEILVVEGQKVKRGEVIGNVGSTGYSTGPHLHFEVRVNGSPVDPLGYL